MSDQTSSNQSWHQWLTTDQPTSRGHARSVQFYLGWLSFKSNKLAMVGFLILLTLVLTWLFAPWLATHNPLAQNLGDRLLPPSGAHFLAPMRWAAIFILASSTARASLYILSPLSP